MPSLSRGFTFFFGLRSAAAFGIALTPYVLERRLIVEARARPAATAARRGAGPRVVGVSTAATLAATATATRVAVATATAGAARHLLHLRWGVPQRRADLGNP